MKYNNFYREKLLRIFQEKDTIIDIGGGLRISNKNNRKKHNNFLDAYAHKCKVMDKVPDYSPDLVGDIHSLPFKDNSVEAFTCIAVLEHVEEPQKAVKEMYRCLKPGGYCFIYVPFIFFYHPMKGYYDDFYRFTIDGVKYMTRDFKEVEVRNERGAVETLVNMIPFMTNRVKGGSKILEWIDNLLGKKDSNQTSGYYLFCVK